MSIFSKTEKISSSEKNAVTPLEELTELIADWPDQQAEAALLLLNNVLEGGGEAEVEKYTGELTIVQLRIVMGLLKKIYPD